MPIPSGLDEIGVGKGASCGSTASRADRQKKDGPENIRQVRTILPTMYCFQLPVYNGDESVTLLRGPSHTGFQANSVTMWLVGALTGATRVVTAAWHYCVCISKSFKDTSGPMAPVERGTRGCGTSLCQKKLQRSAARPTPCRQMDAFSLEAVYTVTCVPTVF